MPTKSKTKIWSDEERVAMQESARERTSQARRSPDEERAAGEAEIQAKIADMPADDAAMATRLHQLVSTTAPTLVPRTYYGMPAYARDGKVVCFFQAKSKFKVRYSTFGFQPDARIDDGDSWPVAFAILKLTPQVEGRIAALVKKAAS
ncbi:MAG: DUF1801 domain-containing protein [Chloroflexota bacterium]